MRNMFLGLLAILFLSIPAQSQDVVSHHQKNTLLGDKGLTGGFVGFSTKLGETNKQEDAWLGGEVAAIFGNNLAIGVAGYGLINTIESPNLDFNDSPQFYQSGYGGIYVEPILFNRKVLSLSFPTVLGGGGIAETRVGGVIDDFEDFDLEASDLHNSDFFWLAEPGVAVNLNISRWMRLSAGASYRYAYSVDSALVEDDRLNSLNGNVSLKFGWF